MCNNVNETQNNDERKKFWILAIDDSDDFQLLIKKALKKYKDNLDVVESGYKALELIKQKKYNLIISDIEMSDMSGIDLCKQIRVLDKSIPVFALTAHTEESIQEELLTAGFTKIIQKINFLKKIREEIDLLDK